MTPPLTPAERAAELYPNSWIRPEGDSFADALRAAYIIGDAEGYARAIEAVENFLRNHDHNQFGALALRECLDELRALATGKEQP